MSIASLASLPRMFHLQLNQPHLSIENYYCANTTKIFSITLGFPYRKNP